MTYRIHGLQDRISVDVHVHRTPTLDASIHHAVTCISKAKILFLERDHRISNGELHVWEIVCRRVGTPVGLLTTTTGHYYSSTHVSLTILVILRAWNGVVDSFHKAIIDQTQCGTGVHDGGVSRAGYGLSVDAGGRGLNLPKSLAVVDISIVGLRGSSGCQSVLIDESKGVETLFDC
jgi:hypothetical protein